MGLVTRNGDFYTFTVKVDNAGPDADLNVEVTDVLPAGMAFVSYTSTQGIFNHATGVWSVGVLNVTSEATLKIKTVVTDVSLAPFVNTAVVSGDNVDPNNVNNTFTETVTVTTCPPSAGALGNANSCLCGNLSTNDTECDHGTTEFRLSPGSTVNLDASFSININTGEYNATGLVQNPYAQASFEYSIWCIVGVDQFETSGPAQVVIPAQFPVTFTDSLTDNSDGTFTHTSMSGVSVIFQGGWTTVVSDNLLKTVTFTYPDATTEVVDISGWFVDTTVANFSVSGGGFLQYQEVTDGVAGSLIVTPVPASATVENVSTIDATIYTTDFTFNDTTLRNHTKVNDSGGVIIDITLPDPVTFGLPIGQTSEFTFKRVNLSPRAGINFTVTNGKYIDGVTSVTMADEPQSSLTFFHDNVNWFRK